MSGNRFRVALRVAALGAGTVCLSAAAAAPQQLDVPGSADPIGGCAATAAVITGTEGRDVIVGTRLPETIFGKGGDDWIVGGGGNDVIYGGLGADTVDGEAGDDCLYGGPEVDNVLGGDGDDYLDGGSGVDRVNGGFGNDEWVWDLNEMYLDPDQAGSGP